MQLLAHSWHMIYREPGRGGGGRGTGGGCQVLEHPGPCAADRVKPSVALALSMPGGGVAACNGSSSTQNCIATPFQPVD